MGRWRVFWIDFGAVVAVVVEVVDGFEESDVVLSFVGLDELLPSLVFLC
jgi:hypothetical protein